MATTDGTSGCFYEPDTGKQHWGRFYMTAPATWYLYQALLGYSWHQPAGVLALQPNLPAALMPFQGPLFLPDYWAQLTISADGRSLGLKRLKCFKDSLPLRELHLPRSSAKVEVLADGVPVAAARRDPRPSFRTLRGWLASSI